MPRRTPFGYTAEEMVGAPIAVDIDQLLPEEVEILAKLRRGERIEDDENERCVKYGSGRRVLTVSPSRCHRRYCWGLDIARKVRLRAAMAEREELPESERAARNEGERRDLKDEVLATLSMKGDATDRDPGWCSVPRRKKNLIPADKDAIEPSIATPRVRRDHRGSARHAVASSG